MKTNKITTSILAIVLLVGMSLSASAQRGQRGQGYGYQNSGQGFNQNRQFAGNCAYMQLSEDQLAQVTKLQLTLTENNLSLQNELDVMRAQMQALRTGDKQNLKDISNLIDDMSATQAQIRKNTAKHQLAVRALLTDDQKVMFDARQGNRGNRGNRSFGSCKGGMNKGNMGHRGSGNSMRGNRGGGNGQGFYR